MTNSLPWYRWPIEIDGLLFLEMVIFHGEMLNNQMVTIISIYIYIYIYSFSVIAINWNWLWMTYRCSQFITCDRPQCRSPVGHPLVTRCRCGRRNDAGCPWPNWSAKSAMRRPKMWAVLSDGGPIVSWEPSQIVKHGRNSSQNPTWHLALRNESRIDSYRWSRFWSRCESWLIKKSSYENCNFAKYGVYQVYHGNSLWNSWFWAQPGWPQLPVCSLHRKRAGSWKPGGWHHAQRHGLEPWNIQFSVDCYGYFMIFMATSAMSLKTIWDIKKYKKLASTPLSASLGQKIIKIQKSK